MPSKLSVLMMKEKSLVIYWHSKDYDANAIYRKLGKHFGDGAPGFNSDEVVQTRRFWR
jgi:hypothetical protein